MSVHRKKSRHTRHISLPYSEEEQKLELADATHRYAFFTYPKSRSSEVVVYDFEEDIFIPSFTVPLSVGFGIQQLKVISDRDIVIIEEDLNEGFQRILVIKMTDDKWKDVESCKTVNREFSRQQELQPVSYDGNLLFLVDVHLDFSPNPNDPDFSDPLISIYRIPLNIKDTSRLPIHLLGSQVDRSFGRVPQSTLSSDGTSVILVKTIFNMRPPDKSNNYIGTEQLDHTGYSLQSISLSMTKVNLDSGIFESLGDKTVVVPPLIHEANELSTFKVFDEKMILSERGSCIVCGLLDQVLQVIEFDNSNLVYAVHSVLDSNTVTGVSPSFSSFFRSYFRHAHSLRAMSHSEVQLLLRSSQSNNSQSYSISTSHELIRYLHQ